MGFILPAPDSARERVKALMDRKDAIQAELDAQFSILSLHQSTMHTPLVDREGFPRGDIDVFAVRHARVRIIELRNDMTSVMNDIAKALETLHANPINVAVPGEASTDRNDEELRPFAKVNGVAPGSPAASAVSITLFLMQVNSVVSHMRITSRACSERTLCYSLDA